MKYVFEDRLQYGQYLANHQIVEFNGCEENKINNSDFVREIFLEAAKLGNATIVNECFHEFSPYGITGVLVIAHSIKDCGPPSCLDPTT